MRTYCPNFDDEDGLETVLEVPIPEEMFPSAKNKRSNMKSWMKMNLSRALASFSFSDRNSQIQLLLGVIGAPLIPLPTLSDHLSDHCVINSIKDHPIESSTAKYIVLQYIAAIGGNHALNSIDSIYAMGKVKMMASEFIAGEGLSGKNPKADTNKVVKVKGMKHNSEVGAFVLWQKKPDLWCLELVVSGTKISAGSDGKVAWRQTPWHNSHAFRGPARLLRRSLQGLDPRLTANLFSNALCIGEELVNNENCFVLKLAANPSTLEARNTSSSEIIRHTVWGYFSQRTGLLVRLQDTHLLRIKTSKSDNIFCETTIESLIQDYQTINGVNIAHSGKTSVSLFRYGDNSQSHSRTRMEEVWFIEEVDFNIKGLSMDSFLPPANITEEDEGFDRVVTNNIKLVTKPQNGSKETTNMKLISTAKVVPVDHHSENSDGMKRC